MIFYANAESTLLQPCTIKNIFKTNIRAHASHTMFLNIVSVSSLSCCENKQMRKKKEKVLIDFIVSRLRTWEFE